MKENINTNKWDFNKFKDQKFKLSASKFESLFNNKEKLNNEKLVENARIKQEKWIREKLLPPNFNSPYTADQYISQQTFKLYCNMYSFSDEETLLHTAKICDLVFVIDDLLLEDQIVGIEYVESLFNKYDSKNHDHFGIEFWDLFNSLYKNGLKESVDIVISETKKWALCSVELKTNLKNYFNKCDPLLSNVTIEDYIGLRINDCGIIFSVESYSTHLLIQDEIRNSDDFKKMFYWAGCVILLVNDCFSFKNELSNELYNNYIKIKTVQSGSIQFTMDYTTEFINNSIVNAKQNVNNLLSKYPNHEDLKVFTDSILTNLSRCASIYFLCDRYK